MATLKSNLMKKKHIHRAYYDGKHYTVTGIFKWPEAGAIDGTDILLAVPVGENQLIKSVQVTGFGITTAAGTLGVFQKLGPDGNALVVHRNGPSAYAPSASSFTSPATNTTALQSTPAVLNGVALRIEDIAYKTAGPLDVGVDITTAGTVAAGAELHVTVVLEGEHSDKEITSDPFMDNSYLL